MSWIYYAITAAIVWGFSYAVQEKLLHKICIQSELAATYLIGFIATFLIALSTGSISKDLQKIDSGTIKLIFTISGLSLLANFCIASAIKNKNASLASIIEISYPLFTILASYLLYGEKQVNNNSIIAGLLIFSGVTLLLKS